MRYFWKVIPILLAGILLCSVLNACKDDPTASVNGDEPAPSVGSEPFTPEDVFKLILQTKELKLSVLYTEKFADGTVTVTESAIVERDGDRVKASISDNDEEHTYYYDFVSKLGYQQDEDGSWASVSLNEGSDDWQFCVEQAFAPTEMNTRMNWLFASSTYHAYDSETGRCVMKTQEMQSFFGSNWTDMNAYLMQSGKVFYLYMTTSDSVGSFTFKVTVEPADLTVTLPN